MDLKELKFNVNKDRVIRHPWELARLKVAIDIIDKFTLKKNIHTIFDIGCGDTFFIESLSHVYSDVHFYGIDTAFTNEFIFHNADRLKQRNIFLFSSIEDALIHCNNNISIVLLMDVIEHINNDVTFLKNLHKFKKITSETLILITVPAFQNLFCKHDIFLEHYRRYTNHTLTNTLNITGYKIIKIGYFFTSLLLPRILQIIKEKYFENDSEKLSGLTEWQSNKFKTYIIKNILILDFKIMKLFNNKIPGLSNFVICKKNA